MRSKIALDWSPDDIRAMATVNQLSIDEARVWWEKHTAGEALSLLALNRALDRARRDISVLAARLRSGTISLAEWQIEMARIIRDSQLAGAMAANDGVLDPAAQRRVEERIEFHLGKLVVFAAAIATGMKLDGRLGRIMRLYLYGARASYFDVEGILRVAGGFTEYINVLGAGEDHCTGGGSCPEVTDQGFQPVGTLTPIGSRNCLTHCLCTWVYRNPVTGELR